PGQRQVDRRSGQDGPRRPDHHHVLPDGQSWQRRGRGVRHCVITARARRDPYGNLLGNAMTPYLGGEPAGTNPDGSSRLGFGGHEREPNLGLVDMNARFYSPHLGRFISPDSVIPHPFDRREYNPYAYVWNNPVFAT